MSDSKKEVSVMIEETVEKYVPPVRKDWYKKHDLTDPEEVKRLIGEIVNG